VKKRLCEICKKPLSIYNKSDVCFCHQRGDIIKDVTKTICTSRTIEGLSIVEHDYYGKSDLDW